jgi:malonate-semialdehyde dehydrogenase (acetylating)/methylmalonate-semialdehyde dehydrogenase
VDALANSIVLEQGKTFAGSSWDLNLHFILIFTRFSDAQADVRRGLQVVEHAIGVTSHLMGEKLEGMSIHHFNCICIDSSLVSKDMDTEVRKLPLGVCARLAVISKWFTVYLTCLSALRRSISQRTPYYSRVSSILITQYRMIPLWSIPIAAVTGNTLVLKPSERDPGAAMIIAELCAQAGSCYTKYHHLP